MEIINERNSSCQNKTYDTNITGHKVQVAFRWFTKSMIFIVQ